MLHVITLKRGDRVLLADRAVAEVTENMDDGMWVRVRLVDVPKRRGDVGTSELRHAQDILRVIERRQD